MLISIIMSVYKEPLSWIQSATVSVLVQTYSDIELLVAIDDPNNQEAIDYFNRLSLGDCRVKFVVNEKNIGLLKSLNRLLKLAKGDFIARMDADDISLPTRLARQISYLEENPDISLVGTDVILIDESSKHRGVMHAVKTEDIESYLFFKTPAFHPTWLFRSGVLDIVSEYPNFPHAEDYCFLLMAHARGVKIGNLNTPLLKYRVNKNSISNSKSYFQFRGKEAAISIYKKNKLSEIGENRIEEIKHKNYILYSIHNVAHSIFIYSSRCKYMKFLMVLSVMSPYYLKHFYRGFILRIKKNISCFL